MGHLLKIHAVNDVRLDAYERPEPGPKDVVVKMKACGICGSDLTYIKVGGMPREPGGTTALGHEGAGEIMFVGSDVADISVGQAVIVNPHSAEDVADGIARALAMPLAERQERHRALLECVTTQDVRWWSRLFMDALAGESEAQPLPRLAEMRGATR